MNLRALPLLFLCAFAPLREAVPASAPPEPQTFPFEMIRLPAGFFVARDETTQAQYEEIAGETPSHFPDPDGRRPVESVSWEDADEFCQRLTERERAAGRLPVGWRFDLPTDAQFDEFLADADLRAAVTSLTGRRDGPEPVGARPPNRLGLRDVLGNVWEWCRDWYDESIRRKDANPDVPAGAIVAIPLPPAAPIGSGSAINGPDDPPDERYKVLRGGAWDTAPADGFSPRARLRYAPGMANAHTGFRCVLVRDGE